MSRRLPAITMTLTAALVASPAFMPWARAQSNANTTGATAAGGAAGQAAPETAPPVSVQSPAGTLGVASVTLRNGWRASKVIGSAVYNEQNQKIGDIDDLIVTDQDKIVLAVIQVGGFLGIGGKLVAVPYQQLRLENGKRTLTGASKEALNRMPAFTYGNG